MQFEWDKEKAKINLKKHGISFEEAETVWEDFFNIDLFDDEHSEGERRFLMVGESEQNRLLIVSYTEREIGVRIISARELTPKEKENMNTDTLNDELKPEYDLKSMRVRKVGEGRKLLNQIQLDVDVAKVFPDSNSVNEALRFLMRITKQHQTELNQK